MLQNFVAGRWIDGPSTTANINPSNTKEIIGEYAQGDAKQTMDAIASARTAFPIWSRSTPQQRFDVLSKISEEILARKEELGRLLAREEGKTLPEAIGEVARAGQIFAFFASEALHLTGETGASLRPGIDINITREAVGVIGVITPWNFPIAIPAWKIAPAICYGNTVVFKPAELVPGSAHALTEIIARSGLPAGVFNLVAGSGSIVGQAMLDSADIDAISFTGSVSTGRHIAASCISGNRMKKFQLEMGGKNPLVILDDAEINVAVEAAINGAYFSTGQRCTASSRLIVTAGIHDHFVHALSTRLESIVVDDALKPSAQIGPVVDETQLEQDLSYIEIGRNEGAKLHFGGAILQRATPGYFLQPVIFTEVNNDMRIAREEIFGPIAAVIRARDYDEALALANDTQFGLAAGICTTSLKHATHFKRNIEAGMVMVNLPTAGVDYHVPFGGRKGSSFGPREQGTYAREFYTTVKTSYTFAG